MPDPLDGRHQTHANIERLWNSGTAQVLPLGGEPWCRLRLDPAHHEISLQTAYQSPEPETANLRNLSFEGTVEAGQDTATLTARVPEDVIGPYSFLAAVADGLQLRHAPLSDAVAVAISHFKDVLAQRSAMSREQEVGLTGELSYLKHLLDQRGPAAVLLWLGPGSEEHDFVVGAADIEVKTTTSERRQHLVRGTTQLTTSEPRALYLLSYQLTEGAPGEGSTLPELVTAVSRVAGGFLPRLRVGLARVGWRDEDASLYTTVWRLRSRPRYYLVDDDFPVITTARLQASTPNSAAIGDLIYRVDLTHLTAANPPADVDDITLTEEL